MLVKEPNLPTAVLRRIHLGYILLYGCHYCSQITFLNPYLNGEIDGRLSPLSCFITRFVKLRSPRIGVSERSTSFLQWSFVPFHLSVFPCLFVCLSLSANLATNIAVDIKSNDTKRHRLWIIWMEGCRRERNIVYWHVIEVQYQIVNAPKLICNRKSSGWQKHNQSCFTTSTVLNIKFVIIKQLKSS